jgi:hypothetical protein
MLLQGINTVTGGFIVISTPTHPYPSSSSNVFEPSSKSLPVFHNWLFYVTDKTYLESYMTVGYLYREIALKEGLRHGRFITV